MSRLIEFRATRKDTGKTFEVLCIDFMHNSIFLDGHMIEIDINSVIIEQFTGLLDCNGVKIFEGDIVRDHNGIGEVQYSDKKAAFKVNYHDGFAKWFIDYNLKGERESIEVIGNIHQNSELLK